MTDQPDPDYLALPGTVKLYHRHLVVCTGRAGWPSHVELDGGYCQALAEALAAGPLPFKVKLTACDAPNRPPAGGRDLLLFPDGLRFLNVRPRDFRHLIHDLLLNRPASGRLPCEPLAGRHVFVCVHTNCDARCGDCGPPVADRFRAELSARDLQDAVAVYRTSHVGGHVFAANVLIYPAGDWYGRVRPDDVPLLVERHLLAGELVLPLWRGRLGLDPAGQQALAARLAATGAAA